MTIKNWLESAKQQIDSLDAELILQQIKGYDDRSKLVINEDLELSVAEREKAEKMLARRLAGEPMAYILGYKEFYGRSFKVNKDVLIPRPETEAAVDYILEKLSFKYSQDNMFVDPMMWQVVDVGTGSGCIATVLWLELKRIGIAGVDITASDISAKALKVAEENFEMLKQKEGRSGKIKFMQSDLLDEVKIHDFLPTIIVANLPYVARDWSWIDKKQLSFEPESALFAEQNGLELVYRLIDQFAEKFHRLQDKKTAVLVLEVDNSQQEKVIDCAKKLGFNSEKISDYILALA